MPPSSLVVQLNLKRLLKEPTHDDIIEAKEFYIQLSFERYKGKLVLRFKSQLVYIKPFKPSALLYETSANSAKPDQTPPNAVSDQVLYCMLIEYILNTKIKG